MRSEAPMNSRLAVTVLLSLVPTIPCTAAAQTARVGAHYGVNLSDGHWEDERLGAQVSVHIVGPLETAGAFSVLTAWPGATGFTGSAWQAYWTMRVRPRGPLSFASVGYGFIVLGLEAPTPHVRPFADLYLIDILDRESAVGVNLLMGIQIPVPTRNSN